jgi:chromosome partitioning protein
MMAQVISTIQSKGGACKSTMIQCIAAMLGKDGHNVIIVDTDKQASCIAWAKAQDVENVDTLPYLDEDTILDVIEGLKDRYDVILIDTAGFDSRMASYAIQASDLILIPSGGSKDNVLGAARSWKHAIDSTKNHKSPPKVRLVLWGVKRNSKVFEHAKQTIEAANIPIVNSHVSNLVGFESMSWNGGLPDRTAKIALNEFMRQLKLDNLIPCMNREVENGQAA